MAPRPGNARARLSLAAAALLAALRPVGADKVHLVNGVMKLEEANFDMALEKFPTLMVQFYAPWCGGCNGFHPTYEKAARALRKRDMPAPRLAKVDVTIEPKLKKKYQVEVNTEPFILVFKNGQQFAKYEGGLYKQDITEYLDTLAMASPVGEVWRVYLRAAGFYKDLLNLVLPMPVPKKYRKFLEQMAPVAVIGAPIIFLLTLVSCVRCCCSPHPEVERRMRKTPKKLAEEAKEAKEEEKEPSKKED
mmetsp:Transcript_55988/g.126322  ORF Transcript_55988/g.126322 Transcript_55988/m.126322 type:complete len:248 (+) Transcript_55988:76-819(+)